MSAAQDARDPAPAASHEPDGAGPAPAAELPALAATAVAIAVERAAESARPDRLFDDPLAAGFVAAATPPGEQPATPIGVAVPVMAGYVPLRTRWFDDRLLAAVARGCGQVVLLAAGLDARAFRLAFPRPVTQFELDVPELLAVKEPLVAEAVAAGRGERVAVANGRGERDAAGSEGVAVATGCERVVVAVDLRGAWEAELLAAGLDPAVPTAWLAEGLLMYLTAEQNDRLLATVGRLSAPGSVLLAEHVPTAGARPPETDGDGHVVEDAGASWRSTQDDPLAWLAAHGWSARAADASAVAAAAGRPLPPVLDRAAVGDACAWLLEAERPARRVMS